MSEAVVDGLEVVQVEEEDGQPVVTPVTTLEGVRHPVEEERAVRESGQGIVEGLVRELRFERLAIAHVARIDDDAPHGGVVQEIRPHGLDHEPPSVAVLDAPFGGRRHRPRIGGRRERRGRVDRIIGVQERHQWVALHLRWQKPKQFGDRRTHVAEYAVDVRDGDEVGRVLHERTESGLVLTGCGLRDEPRVLAHGRDLPEHDEDGEYHAALGQIRPLLPGPLDRFVDQQRVTQDHGQIREQRKGLNARAAETGPLAGGRRRRIPGVPLARPRQEQIGGHEGHVRPMDPAIPDALQHQLARQVGRQIHGDAEQEQDEWRTTPARWPAEYHGDQSEGDGRVAGRVCDVEESTEETLRVGERGRAHDEVPDGDPESQENRRGVVQELALLGLHASGAREREQRDQPTRIEDQIREPDPCIVGIAVPGVDVHELADVSGEHAQEPDGRQLERPPEASVVFGRDSAGGAPRERRHPKVHGEERQQQNYLSDDAVGRG